MGGADGYRKVFGQVKRSGTGRFGGDPFKGCYLGYAGAHGFDNLPTAAKCAQRNGRKTRQRYPPVHIYKRVEIHLHTQGIFMVDDGGTNDTHYFLRIVSTMTEAEQCR